MIRRSDVLTELSGKLLVYYSLCNSGRIPSAVKKHKVSDLFWKNQRIFIHSSLNSKKNISKVNSGSYWKITKFSTFLKLNQKPNDLEINNPGRAGFIIGNIIGDPTLIINSSQKDEEINLIIVGQRQCILIYLLEEKNNLMKLIN